MVSSQNMFSFVQWIDSITYLQTKTYIHTYIYTYLIRCFCHPSFKTKCWEFLLKNIEEKIFYKYLQSNMLYLITEALLKQQSVCWLGPSVRGYTSPSGQESILQNVFRQTYSDINKYNIWLMGHENRRHDDTLVIFFVWFWRRKSSSHGLTWSCATCWALRCQSPETERLPLHPQTLVWCDKDLGLTAGTSAVRDHRRVV